MEALRVCFCMTLNPSSAHFLFGECILFPLDFTVVRTLYMRSIFLTNLKCTIFVKYRYNVVQQISKAYLP